MWSSSSRVAIAALLGIGAAACGGNNPEPQQPLALAKAPEAEVPYSRACGVERITVKPTAAHSATESSITLEGRVDVSCAEIWLIAHRVGTLEYTVQSKGTVKSNGDWISRATFDSTSVGTEKIFEILAIANPHKALEPEMTLNGWPKAGARSEVVVVNRTPIPESKPCPKPDAKDVKDAKE